MYSAPERSVNGPWAPLRNNLNRCGRVDGSARGFVLEKILEIAHGAQKRSAEHLGGARDRTPPTRPAGNRSGALAIGRPIWHPRGVASSAFDDAERLARRAVAVTDLNLRVAYLRRLLPLMDPSQAANVLTIVLAQTEARQGHHRELMLALSLALSHPELDGFRKAIVAAADAQGQAGAAMMLRHDPSGDPHPNDKTSRNAADFGRDRPLTLGERKALARRTDRNVIRRALRDHHPSVVAILLGNPILTEDDVVRLCAQRPIEAETLRAVFRNTKWIVRYRVKLTLVKNPHTPLEIALSLCAHLQASDAHDVAESPELHGAVRKACSRSHAGPAH